MREEERRVRKCREEREGGREGVREEERRVRKCREERENEDIMKTTSIITHHHPLPHLSVPERQTISRQSTVPPSGSRCRLHPGSPTPAVNGQTHVKSRTCMHHAHYSHGRRKRINF